MKPTLADAVAKLATLTDLVAKAAGAPAGGFPDPRYAGTISGGGYAGEDERKGAGFARAVKVLALSRLDGISVETALERLDKGSGQPYGEKLKACVSTISKALGESTVAGGGVFAPDEFSADFIEFLRPMLALVKAGVREIPMSGQTLTRGRQSAASSATWLGENAAITYSQPAFDSPQLSLKKVAILAAISNDLIRDQAVSSEVVVRDDLVKVALLAIDLSGIRGAGTQFTPKGIRNAIPSTNVHGSQAAAGTPSLQNAAYDFEVQLTGLLNGLNVPMNKRVSLLHPRTLAGLRQLRDGVGRFPIAEEIDRSGTIFGLKFFPTTQIPINLSGGGSGTSVESEIYGGEAPETEMGIGMQPTIEVSREASFLDANGAQQNAFANDQTVIRMIARLDWILRHAFSWAVVNGTTYGA